MLANKIYADSKKLFVCFTSTELHSPFGVLEEPPFSHVKFSELGNERDRCGDR